MSLFCQRTSPQAEQGGGAEPGLGGFFIDLLTVPGLGRVPGTLTLVCGWPPGQDKATIRHRPQPSLEFKNAVARVTAVIKTHPVYLPGGSGWK